MTRPSRAVNAARDVNMAVVPSTPEPEHEMNGRLEWITVDRASAWLDKCRRNRPIDWAHVRRLSQDILAGDWHPTGEAILINERGELMDGQHRCWAIIEAKTPAWIFVVYGVPDSSFAVLGSGKSRSAADTLALDGHQNAKALSPAARALILWENTGTLVTSGRRPVSTSQILHYVEQNPLLNEWAHEGVRMERAALGGRGIWTAILYRLSKVDPQRTREFADALISGAGLGERSPILKLRNRLTRKGDNLDNVDKAALTMKAWNIWRRGGNVDVLSWRRTGEAREDIPVPE